MPREAGLSVDEIFHVLKDRDVFHQDGQIVKKSDKVWQTASAAFNHILRPPTIYLYVSSDWHGLGAKIRAHQALTDSNLLHTKNKTPTERLCAECPDLTFSISFSEEEWRQFAPYERENGRKHFVEKIWAHAVMQKIWDSTGITCPYSFKNNYVKKDGTVKFNGYCTECQNELTAECPSSSEGHTFLIHTKDTKMSIFHVKKRPFSNVVREAGEKELCHTKATKFQRAESKKQIKYGQVEGPLVHKTDVLRKARQQAVFKKYGVKSTKNVVGALIGMKVEEKWSNIIWDIGDFPFSLIFCSPEQIDLWQIISETDISISIDAAGKFVKKLKTNGELSAHIYLYVVSASVGGKIYPLFQFLSEYQATIFVKDCFLQWLEKGAPKPKEVVIDGSAALQNSVCLAFSNCTFKKYRSMCYAYLMESEGKTLPACFLRSDIAHLIKSISRWKCFEKAGNCKDFYLRIIGYLSKITSFTDFISIAKSVLIVCQSPMVNEKINYHQTFLSELIVHHEVKYCSENCACDFCNEKRPNPAAEDDELCQDDSDDLVNEIDRIVKDGLDCACKEGCSKNNYYCTGMVENFKVLCLEFMIWTNIMTNLFQSSREIASSGRSESLFCDLRHITGIDSPISAHLFIAIYNDDFLEGAMKLARAFIEQQKIPLPSEKNSNGHSESKLAGITEGVSTDNSCVMKETPTKKRGKYLEKCPELDILHNRPSKKLLKNVIQNGNLLKSVQHKGKLYTYKSTCLFDSLMELSLVACREFASYNDLIDCQKHNVCFLKVARKYSSKEGKDSDLYSDRFNICLEIYDSRDTLLKCRKPIGVIITDLLKDCMQEKFYIELKPKLAKEILNMQNLPFHISQCLGKDQPSNFLFVNIQAYKIEAIKLKDIPVKVKVNSSLYMLIGLITHGKSKYNINLLHYVAYCRSVTTGMWYLRDDLLKKSKVVRNETSLVLSLDVLKYVKVDLKK